MKQVLESIKAEIKFIEEKISTANEVSNMMFEALMKSDTEELRRENAEAFSESEEALRKLYCKKQSLTSALKAIEDYIEIA